MRYHPWCSWKEQSFVTFATVAKRKAQQYKETLTGVRWEDNTYTTVTSMGGKDREPVAFLIGNHQFYIPPDGERLRQETMLVQARALPCTVIRKLTEENGVFVDATVWVSGECPFPLKIVCKASGEEEYESVLTAVVLDESIEICGRTASCVRLEGLATAESGTAVITQWLSKDVPGATVGSRMIVTKWGDVEEYALDAIDFGGSAQE